MTITGRKTEYDDPSDERARQTREVSELERLNSTPRLELATHRPLAQIKAFTGLRNKSENVMQWLRTFVYEMKGNRTPPNEWCMAFELSLRDGAFHCLRRLGITRPNVRAANMCAAICIDYTVTLATLEYNLRGEDGIPKIRFLESCGDRGLERRLCHLRVKGIHELEDIINAILKSEAQSSTRETSAYLSRGRDRSHKDSEARMMAELQVRESKYGRSERSKSRDVLRSFEDSSSEVVADRSTDDDQSGSDYTDPYYRHVAAANDSERRTEAIGTYGRSENRGRRGDFSNRGLDRNSRHQGPDRHHEHLPSNEGWQERPPRGATEPSLQRRFKLGSPRTETGLVPIGLPQLASPSVDADCVYAFVGESKWLKAQRREDATKVKTMEIEKERHGSVGEGEVDERSYDEWNGDSSEGLVSSIARKTWHDYQERN
ncbi:unnamed protein product [Phytophthora fragariaefolia]|uniref:Unnamed protein product n=1 Tax=Phytophthora fragariaefolia TaxID=1490495 RepID=A0A9W6XCQ6_9STRA|nr:unnamed protein product [Phytophthora fragariaefolia]